MSIDTKKFINILIKNDIKFASGVPDSCVAPFINAINKIKNIKNYVLPNEGLAVSFGIGYYLATKKIPLIYLQNSGLGNATDPITNLCNQNVYGIPLVLLVGWRGHPKYKDEPQHITQGKTLKKTLFNYGIKYVELKTNRNFVEIKKLINLSKKKSKIVAILVPQKKLVKAVKDKKKIFLQEYISRDEFILTLFKKIKKKTRIFTSVGFNSREAYKIISENKLDINPFYLVGAMGHTASVSLGYNIFSKKSTICIDGDGSFIMHLGSLVNCGNLGRSNFKYIILDNQSHESVGEVKNNFYLDYKKFSQSLGFKKFFIIDKNKDLKKIIEKFVNEKSSSFLYVKIKIKKNASLPRIKNFKKILNDFLIK